MLQDLKALAPVFRSCRTLPWDWTKAVASDARIGTANE